MEVILMKKVLAFIFAVFMFYIPYYVHSANGLYFDLEYSGDKIQLNRGFDIYFNAKSNSQTKISALRLDIKYDNSKLKFLSATANTDIDTYEPESGTVRIVWLNNSGQTTSSQSERLFTIRFKPLNSTDNASYSFSTKIFEAVNSDAEYLTIENSPSITVNKSGDVISSASNTSSKTERNKTESNKKRETSRSKNNFNTESNEEQSNENTEENTTDISIGNRKSIKSENGFTYFIFGAGGMLILVALIFLAYNLGKKHNKKNK